MANVVILAFIGEVIGSCLQQWAFVMQKLAHRKLEEQQKRNLVMADGPSNKSKDDEFANVEATIEKDVSQTMKVYCSWRWMLGMFALLCSVVIHVFMLPYLDLTLLAAKQVIAIVSAVILSISLLDEVIVWRYDLPAFLLISAGCTTIVLSANKTETSYSAEEVRALLVAPRTLCFLGFCLICIIISVTVLGLVLRRLRQFEKDVESYEQANGITDEA